MILVLATTVRQVSSSSPNLFATAIGTKSSSKFFREGQNVNTVYSSEMPDVLSGKQNYFCNVHKSDF